MRNSAPGQRLRQSEKTNVARTKSLISVVDDDRSMSRMLYRVITAAGLDVVSFASAEEFLDSGALGDSACLILDMHLPGMSGIELQQHLNASGLEIPIIFISAQADEAAKRQVLEAGAAGFFNKPFSIESLLATVRSIPSLALT
jgi:FixJ family two-component response regulator